MIQTDAPKQVPPSVLLLGHQLDGDPGKFLGAAAGAITGGVVGNYMDQQEQNLVTEQQQHAIEIYIKPVIDGQEKSAFESPRYD